VYIPIMSVGTFVSPGRLVDYILPVCD
jgi:hypothetical protein